MYWKRRQNVLSDKKNSFTHGFCCCSNLAIPNMEKLAVPTNCSLEVPTGDVGASPTKLKSNYNFMRKIPKDAEASNILIGEMNELDKCFLAFIRLEEASFLGDLTEVPIPTRFLFILLGPQVCHFCLWWRYNVGSSTNDVTHVTQYFSDPHSHSRVWSSVFNTYR